MTPPADSRSLKLTAQPAVPSSSPAPGPGWLVGSDLALVLDRGGMVSDVQSAHDPGLVEEARAWIGQDWRGLVAPQHRDRMEQMLREAAERGVSTRRLLLHAGPGGTSLPLTCVVVRSNGLVVLATDQREVSALQARLTDAQQRLQRATRRADQLEARQQVLLDHGPEAALLVDATSRRVLEANAAAGTLLGVPVERVAGRPLATVLGVTVESDLRDFLAGVQVGGGTGASRFERRVAPQALRLDVRHLPEDSGGVFVVHATAEPGPDGRGPGSVPTAARVLSALPDPVVVTDGAGLVVVANSAFHRLVGLGQGHQIAGQGLQRWLGRPGADLGYILRELQDAGSVYLLETEIETEQGLRREVELGAGPLAVEDGRCWVFALREIGGRVPPRPREGTALALAVGQLTMLVGKITLKNLMRDTTVQMERHFIEAALAATSGNRTAAAAMLGVSRQSLYVKLRQYGLAAASPPPTPASTRRPRGSHRKSPR